MSTERNPWYRASKDAWFVTFKGKQVRLAIGEGNREQAMTAFYKLMAGAETPKTDQMKVIQLADLFLSWSQRHHIPATFEWHKTFLEKFCDHKGTGRLKVDCRIKSLAILVIHLSVLSQETLSDLITIFFHKRDVLRA